MPNKILYSPLALQDLTDTFNYIANVLNNASAAEATIKGILAKINALKEFPLIGAKLIFESNIDSGYRYICYKNYIAFYRTQANIIYIDRILYQKRDYLRLLNLNNL